MIGGMAAVVVVTAVTVWAYRPAVSADFAFDDVTSIIDNPALHWETVSWDAFRGLFESVRLPRRFVANLTFALNHVAGGLEPGGYHLVNILIHLLVGAALAVLISLYLRAHCEPRDAEYRLLVITLAVLAFLVHPLNTQAVTYVVQRMASLAALFALLSMAMYLAGRTGMLRGPAIVWYVLAFLFFVLGLGTKENVAIVPVVLLTYEWCFHRDLWRDRLWRIWGGSRAKRAGLSVLVLSIVMLAVAGALTWLGGNPIRLFEPWPRRDFNGIERMLTQTRVHWLYLSQLVWPALARLNLDHDFSVSRGLLQPPSTLFALVSLALLIGGAVYLAVRRPQLGFPLLAYFEFHAFESGPVSLELVFEHRMYLPMAMLAIAAAVMLYRLRSRVRIFVLAMALGCVALLAGATRMRNETWSDSVALAYDIAQKSPEKPRAWSNLAGAYRRAERFAEAEDAFKKSLVLDPGQSKAHFGLGSLYLEMGRAEEALAEFQRVLLIQPTNTLAAYLVGQALEDLGKSEEAFTYYMNLGQALALRGRAVEALEPLRRAVAMKATSSPAHNALGNAYLMADMKESAMQEYRVALEYDSDNVQALYNLATLLDEIGNTTDALPLYQRFLRRASPEFHTQVELVKERLSSEGRQVPR